MAFSVALSMVKNELMAEEVVQESFVQAYLGLSSFQQRAKFSTWLYKIVLRTASKYRQKHQLKDQEFILERHDQAYDEHALNDMLREEQKALINEALMAIPSKESVALRLFYLEELSLKEIIEITGWSESNLKVILHRARKSLHATLTLLMKKSTYGT